MSHCVAVALWAAVAVAQQPGYRHGVYVQGPRAPDSTREQWRSRLPMLGGAPVARKVPVAENVTLAKPRAPTPLGAPLWDYPRHRPSRDVITGLALSYREQTHRIFVGSARRAGFAGDFVLVTEPLKKLHGADYLRSMGVIAYGVKPDCSQSTGGSIKHKTCRWGSGQKDLPLAIMRHALYYAIALKYSPDSSFYVADYRDTFFQRDPFAAVVEQRGHRLRGLELLLAAEHWPFKQIGNCPFNGGWVRSCWGKQGWDLIAQQVVLCSGSYMGTRAAILNFEGTLLDEADAEVCHAKGVPSDQGYLNYLFYSGRLPRESFVQDRGVGVINTVGSLDGSRPRAAGYLPPTHVNIGEYWHMFDAEGYVLDDDTRTRSAAVHQYDRFFLEFKQFVTRLGQCDSPGCYSHPAEDHPDSF